MLVEWTVKFEDKLVSEKSKEDKATLVDAERAITHEKVKQLEHLNLGALLQFFVLDYYGVFPDRATVYFQLLAFFVRAVLDDNFALFLFFRSSV